jgi:hypothetical protein
MHHAKSLLIVQFLPLLLSPACSDPAETGGMGVLGIAGASCLRTPDCAPPLQCLANVCTGLSGGPDATNTSDAGDTTGEPTDTALADTNPFYDGPTPDVVTDYDASDWEFLDAPPPSDATTNIPDSTFGGCAELGVSDTWSGNFLGAVDYNITPNPLTPSQGVLPVEGDLDFEIRCIESKLVVRGTMDGIATVEGQGDFPFTMKLDGVYDPETKRMEARMVDAQVNLYELVIVYFEGTFLGQIGNDDRFTGTWEGESTGTNQAFITGTASGEGLWGASPQ